MSPVLADTIVAISTPRGEGGIGIVRLSGAGALAIARAFFRPGSGELEFPPRPRHAYHGTARSTDGETIDECLLTWFRAPRSYTGEDVVELSAHGSIFALGRIVEAACARGARLAEPGEFTRRAFLNGRLDMARAEAVIDVIRARTDAQLRLATRQLGGQLSQAVVQMRAALIGLLASIEAAIDFPDDVEPPERRELCTSLTDLSRRIAALLATADAGRIYREGASLVIAGAPNVGKSSLLNALLGHDRAIVTPIPGTTRDVIEEGLNLDGVPLRAIDTAGLRATDDQVEQLGVARTREEIRSADLVLLVVDASQDWTSDGIALAAELPGRAILVGNKVDLGDRLPAASGDPLVVRVSALTHAGLADLKRTIRDRLVGADLGADAIVVANVRHRASLLAAAAATTDALATATASQDLTAIALDLRIAAESLGEVTGESVTEATINEVFARFCVGK